MVDRTIRVERKSTSNAVDLLVIGVNYKCEAETSAFVSTFLPSSPRIALAVADNSPSSSTGELLRVANDHPSVVQFQEYSDNPGYFGAAHRLIASLQGSIAVRQAVVITNVDLTFDIGLLLEYVDRNYARDPSGKWVLSPDVRETGLRSHRNPHGLDPSVPPRDHLNRFLFRNDASYRLMLALHLLRVRLISNKKEVAARASSRVLSTYGAMFIIGQGFFEAGGFIPEASLFGEEYAIAYQCSDLDVPIWFDPSFVVEHAKSSSTGLLNAGQRRAMAIASWEMYADWSPSDEYGSMAWLVADG